MKIAWLLPVVLSFLMVGSCGSEGPPGDDSGPKSSPGEGMPANPGPSAEVPSGSSGGPGVFPKSPRPAERIHAIDLSRLSHLIDPNQEIISFMTLAGLVNRSEPAIYLAASRQDPWPDWMRERGDIEEYDWVSDPYDLFAWYGARSNGLVVVDPGIAATYNVACVVAACEGLIACHPNHVSRIRRYDPSLGVVRDLRDEGFAHNGEAYTWAYEMYWSEVRHDVLAWIDTSWRPTGPRDYCVAHKVFPLWVNGYSLPWEAGTHVQAEREFAEKILAETPQNIPILGWPGISRGLGEHAGIRLWSQYGKYAVVEGDLTGLSFHSGCSPVSVDELADPAPPDFDIDRIYYATYHSEGELLWHEAPFRTAWENPSRGDIPYGWSVGLLQRELIPALLDWYWNGGRSGLPIQPADELVSAMSGLGYVFPQHYPQKARKAFLKKTRSGLASNGITTLAIHFNDAPYAEKREITGEYGRELGSSANTIFVDYAYSPGTSYGESNYLANGVPVFHALAPHFKRQGNAPGEIAGEFQQRLHDRGAPAFGEIFLMGWSSGPRTALQVRDALNSGGQDLYVPVRPDELGLLYKESGAGVELDFLDDFSAGDDHWTVASGRWRTTGGKYVQEETGPSWHVSRAGNCQWDNVAVSAALKGSRPAEEAGVAVFSRFRGLDNAYYRFELWQDATGRYARLFKKTKGRAPRLLAVAPVEAEIEQGSVLEMVVHCDSISCSLDGSEVILAVDAEPIPRGWIGVGGYGGRTLVSEVRVERSHTCVDCDGDGYGEPGDLSCDNGADWDCDDHDAGEAPGGFEGPRGSPRCSDGLDNDCDGLFDRDDPGCL